jgi:hypothetical protein
LHTFSRLGKSHRSVGLPLGVHIHANGVAIVGMEDKKGASEIRGHATQPVVMKPGGGLREAQVTALERAWEEMHEFMPEASGECILSVLPADVQCARLSFPDKGNLKQLEQHAQLRALDLMPGIEPEKLQIALDPLEGSRDRLMSVAEKVKVDELVQIARDAGLIPKAIDVPLAAWQRAWLDKTDAILDLQYRRPALYVFATPMGHQILLPSGATGAQIATEVRKALTSLRRRTNQASSVERIQIVGSTPDMDDLKAGLKEDDGLTKIEEVSIGDATNPAWTYAAALATWGAAWTKPRRGKA